MQRNPAYYLLSQHHQKKFFGLELIQNEKYALIQLLKSDISEARTFDIQGKTFNLSGDLSEHHLSIYKKMAVQKAKQSILGPFHHTMHLNNSGKNLSLRVYYDCYGKYIESIVKCEREEKEDEDSEEDQRTLKVLECEQLQIRRASESCIKNVMEKIFVELEDKCSTQEKAQNKLLLSLKNESEKNGESQEYLALLDETIIAVGKVNAFSFRPNIALENFLLVRRDSIKKIIEEKSLTKLTIQEKQQLENNLAEEEIDISSMSAAVSQPLMQAEHLTGLFDRPLGEAESRVTHITEKQKIINQLWNIDGLSDLNFALSIIEKQKKLDQLREKYLEQACQENDVQTMRDLFNEETDIYLVKKLMHTAISFRHKESFDFLSAKRTLNYLVKWDQCVIVGEGEGLHGAIARLEASPLQLAYKQRDFHVFTQLLASGAAHPDERNNAGEPILLSCIQNNDFSFAKELLRSGANPDIKVIKSEYEAASLEQESHYERVISPHLDWTPLAYAVQQRKKEAVELLLRFRANPLVECKLRLLPDKPTYSPLGLTLADGEQSNHSYKAMIKHLNEKKILLEYKALLRILCANINLEKKDQVIRPLYCRAYHQAALHTWKNDSLEKAYKMFQNLFRTIELMIDENKEHVLIYDFSCCLFEVGKMKERQGDLQKAKNFFEAAVQRMSTSLAIRQSLQQFPLFSQELVRQAQEKLDEIRTQLGSMRPVQLAVGTA